jgi:hypothetical protein
MKTVIPLILVALLPLACARHKSGANTLRDTTTTIAPANPQPSGVDTGTDAMTQTVLVDDSRSESDGMASASSSKAPATKKAPPKKKSKK